MTTLAQARAAINAANELNTIEAWKLAALAFAELSAKPKGPKTGPFDVKNTGKRMINHVIRVTLEDGYTVRMTFGQAKGDSINDVLARAGELCREIWRCETYSPAFEVPARLSYPAYWSRNISFGLGDKAAMDALTPPAIAECRVVKYGSGPDAGIDLEEPVMLAAAE